MRYSLPSFSLNVVFSLVYSILWASLPLVDSFYSPIFQLLVFSCSEVRERGRKTRGHSWMINPSNVAAGSTRTDLRSTRSTPEEVWSSVHLGLPVAESALATSSPTLRPLSSLPFSCSGSSWSPFQTRWWNGITDWWPCQLKSSTSWSRSVDCSNVLVTSNP